MVMVSASVVAAPAFAMARRNKQSWLGDPISLPDRTRIDRPLIIGAAIFGVGWGLAGLCPGPALVLLGTVRDIGAWIFVPALIVGSFLGRLYVPSSRLCASRSRTALSRRALARSRSDFGRPNLERLASASAPFAARALAFFARRKLTISPMARR
jgi:uncharacterized membrane protein YedE/YeeE